MLYSGETNLKAVSSTGISAEQKNGEIYKTEKAWWSGRIQTAHDHV